MEHPITWRTPAPFWDRRLADGDTAGFRAPALLEIDEDDYVGVLTRTLAQDVGELTELEVGIPGENGPETPKLFHPAHQRFYAVTGSLVCRRQGLPDRSVNAADEERAAFVIRRLEPLSDRELDPFDPDTYLEYGWFENHWRLIPEPEKVDLRADDSNGADGREETRYPLFGLPHPTPGAREERSSGTVASGGSGPRDARERRTWAGFVPVTDREEFALAPVSGGTETTATPLPSDPELADPRLTVLHAEVFEPLTSLRDLLEEARSNPDLVPKPDDVQPVLLFALLDLWDFFDVVRKDVAAYLCPDCDRVSERPAREKEQLEDVDRRIVELLEAVSDLSAPLHWREELVNVAENANTVRTGVLGDLLLSEILTPDGEVAVDALIARLNVLLAEEVDLSDVEPRLPELPNGESDRPALERALQVAVSPPSDPSDLPEELQPPVERYAGGAVYVIRCLYERPRCEPYRPPVLSDRSVPFRMAGVTDADAPARPLRISMPENTDLSDFRDAEKGVSVLFSAQLRNQIERVRNLSLSDVEEGDLNAPGTFSLGMVCTLSIPIITICGLILLLVMVNILNIVFQWLPYFQICFPLPGGSDQ